MNVQNELKELRERLNASKKSMQEKENTKARLERKVEKLKLLYNSEKRTNEQIEMVVIISYIIVQFSCNLFNK
jgi:phage-related tail protein